MSEYPPRPRSADRLLYRGPAGMVLGYLLARAGVKVTVLEKHKDFLRELSAVIGGVPVKAADFSHLPGHCKFIALMPRFAFLRRIPARLAGLGFRPEHVRTPDIAKR